MDKEDFLFFQHILYRKRVARGRVITAMPQLSPRILKIRSII